MELDVLKELLRDGIITLPQWREGMAAIRKGYVEKSAESVIAMELDVLKELLSYGFITYQQFQEEMIASRNAWRMRPIFIETRDVVSEEENTSGVGVGATKGMSDEVLEEDHVAERMGTQVAVTRCICGMDSEMQPIFNETRDVVSAEENTSGVGVGATKGKSVEVVKEGLDAPDVGASAMSGKSQYVQEEEVHVVASAEGMGGDIAYLLYDCSLEDYEKSSWGFRLPFSVSDVASCDAGATPANRPRLFDAAMQQITRLRPSVGAKRPRVRLRLGPSVGARPRVRLRPGQWNMLVARTALKEQAKAEAWRMEIQLVKMQIDAVTDDESVNLGCERSARWGSVTRW